MWVDKNLWKLFEAYCKGSTPWWHDERHTVDRWCDLERCDTYHGVLTLMGVDEKNYEIL